MPKRKVIKVGNTVRLKSGGALMTVISTDGSLATCKWMVKDSIRTDEFPVFALIESDGTPQEITLNFGRNLPLDPSA